MELVISNDSSKTYATLGEYIKILKNDIDRLIDHGPFIPAHILHEHHHTMNDAVASSKNKDIMGNITDFENQKSTKSNKRRRSLDTDQSSSTHNNSPESSSLMTRIDMKNHMIPVEQYAV